MEVRPFIASDTKQAAALWNEQATKFHYKPLTEEEFYSTFIDQRYYDAACTFVAVEEDRVVGFAAGCTGDDLPLGELAGYITTVIMNENASAEQMDAMIERLEARFVELGKVQAEVLFFNPVKLIWTMPSAPGHEHNNAPGIDRAMPLYERLLARGYADRATQCGMHLQLGSFEIPESILGKEEQAKQKGYSVVRYNAAQHAGLAEMLEGLQNPQWITDVARYAEQGVPLPVAVYEGACVGFAGPIIRQENGRAFFCGVGVHPAHEGHGLGSVLFFRMVEAFQEANCDYITLFTGENNPALRIYEKAGFKTEKQFAILRKELETNV